MIAIRVVSRNGQPLEEPLAAVFGETAGDIGRGVDCALVLPDPERRISRHQAQVAWRDGGHVIRRTGPYLDVALDGAELPLDVDVPLAPGAEIAIGPYLLVTEPAAAPFAPTTQRGSVFADLLSPGGASPEPAAAAELDLVIDDIAAAPVIEPARAAAPPAAHASAPTALHHPPVDGAAAALAAFHAGLGLPAPAAGGDALAQLHQAGALLRAAVAGTLDLLAARSAAKHELGAESTRLQARENNPLKFSPSADVALAHLLGPAQRGFEPPLQAVQEAFDDLRAHELALLAGMRAVVETLLGRFDPRALEQRLAPPAAWDALLPAGRRARLWERYVEAYQAIAGEVEGDIDSAFNRAFRQAYEDQLAQLDARARQA